jgi:putative transcriptional regulator
VRKVAKRVRKKAAKSLGARIIEGLEEAVAHERGELHAKTKRVALTARRAEAEAAPVRSGLWIAALRARLNLSQPVFAMALNVSPETVRAWEQGKREPEGAALRLLQLTDQHPAWILDTIRARGAGALQTESEE